MRKDDIFPAYFISLNSRHFKKDQNLSFVISPYTSGIVGIRPAERYKDTAFMSEKSNEDINEELSEVRERLIRINKKVKKFLGHKGESYVVREAGNSRAPRIFKDVSLKDIHEKLRAINTYLRDRTSAKVSITEVPHIEIPHRKTSPKKESSERLGVGLDLGTSYIVTAREVRGSVVLVKSERNAFLSVKYDKVNQSLLQELRMKYVSVGGRMYILGQSALDLSNIFNKEAQRPMKQGILNPSEVESVPMIKMLVKSLLWNPRREKEPCCFSIPSPPIDRDQDTIYHRSVFESILRGFGFQPIIVDEGYAVVLAELGYEDFTGIGISCGGGMVNICAAFRSVPAISFSISRGGDWIDKSAASVLGIPSSKVTAIKEQGMNLKNPLTREQEAITIYYKNFIQYFLKNIAEVFGKGGQTPQFKRPVHIVLAGGTTLIGDFLDVVKEELQAIDLGFSVGSVKRAEEPFTSVAKGCLFNAIYSGASG